MLSAFMVLVVVHAVMVIVYVVCTVAQHYDHKRYCAKCFDELSSVRRSELR